MNWLTINDLNFKKHDGIIPVIVQDCRTLEVLTLEYVNKEALMKTLQTKYTHFYRKSQGKIIKKGATSGNLQRVIEIWIDCDNDTLIFLVEQKGFACHLYMRSCFSNRLKEAKGLRTIKNNNYDEIV